jgi:hypothetical protein
MIRSNSLNRKSKTGRGGRMAFTLFEVILAIALSTLLLMLIGMAINLYLVHMEARRSDVEWAQLARSVFKMIGDDLRAASEYKPQDMSSALAAVSSSLSTALTTGTGSTSGTTGSGTTSGGATASGSTGTTSGQSTGGSTSTSGSSSTGTGTSTSTSSTGGSSMSSEMTGSSLSTTPGVHGTIDELIIDASRPLRFDEIFSAVSGYTGIAAPVETGPGSLVQASIGQNGRPVRSDLKTIRYFIRQGEAINPSSVAATSLTPGAQARAAGLIRQEIDRAQRVAAEQTADQGTLESGQRLVAPEVVRMEIRYFDGTDVLDTWDMQINGGLPPAVEVRLWIADPELINAGFGGQPALDQSREFRQTIYLPQAKPPSTATSTTPAIAADAANGGGSAP